MDTTFLLVITASFVVAPFALLIGGELIRGNINRAAGTGSAGPKVPAGLTRDLQGLEDALVEFFASSRASSCILTVLAARGKPVGFNALVKEIRAEQGRRRDGEDLPTTALRAVLTILQMVRLIQMNRDGFFITDLGREVYRRMNNQLQLRMAIRQHGRRDYSVATHRAPSSLLGRLSTARG
jgi:hypothetical protein